MSLWKNYHQPNSVEDALKCLCEASNPRAVIAGGTDLLLEIRRGLHAPIDVIVDVIGIEEMRQIRIEDEYIFLGAAVTLNEILESAALLKHASCLIEACSVIGGPQVRNVATIGGNVAHALPAGDGTIALLALNAVTLIASPQERRWVPIESLFAGPREVTFDRNSELLVAFRIPLLQDLEASVFTRVMRPQRVAIAILNMAAWLRCSSSGVIEDIRLALGPAGPRPLRARRTEDLLRGRLLDDEILRLAEIEILGEIQLRTSHHRATVEYRQHLLPMLLDRVIQKAYERALG
jgi:carbon-monoxide dehydrogenase medium subunit